MTRRHLVTKIDVEEVAAPARAHARRHWLGVGLLTATPTLGFAWVWRRREAHALRRLLAGERSRRDLQAQLVQSQKLESIGTLAGGVAHEINNPINGITNARDALNERYPEAHPDKRILVSARTLDEEDRQQLRITVEDCGTGIPERERERVFDPFCTTKRPDRGTGLGLSVCYGIVQDHGGAISVESEVGSYTRFPIDLPVLLPDE